jgi:hypothetical protein
MADLIIKSQTLLWAMVCVNGVSRNLNNSFGNTEKRIGNSFPDPKLYVACIKLSTKNFSRNFLEQFRGSLDAV